MKRTTLLIMLALVFFPLKTTFANLDKSDGLFIVDSIGSTTPVSEFHGDMTPFAYLAFNTGDVNTGAPLFINWIWRNSANAIISSQFEQVTNFSSNPLQFWNSVSNWLTVKEEGTWTVDATWTNLANGAKGGFGSAQAKFSASPEPISTVLFATGAIPLGLALYRRRRREHPEA